MVDGVQKVIPCKLSEFYVHGDASVNIPVQPDDVIYVPRADHTDYDGWLGHTLQALSIYNLAKVLFF